MQMVSYAHVFTSIRSVDECLIVIVAVVCRVSCKKTFNKRLKMTDHMRTHSGEKFVACANCGSTFNSYVKFYDHYRRQAITSK